MKNFKGVNSMANQIIKVKLLSIIAAAVSLMSLFFMSNITAAIPMSAETRRLVVVYVNAGMGITSIVALLGGGGLVYFIVKKAFETGIKRLIIAA